MVGYILGRNFVSEKRYANRDVRRPRSKTLGTKSTLKVSNAPRMQYKFYTW